MSNKKTILYLITQSELGGAQKYIFELAENLKDEFNIVVAYGEQGGGGELARMLSEINIEHFIIPGLRRSISLIDDLFALINIIRLIRKIRPDIIHLNSSKISILGSIAGIFAPKSQIANRKPAIVYTAHGWVFNEPARNTNFYKRAEKFTAKLKDKIICVSEFDRRIAVHENIAPEQKLITVHNGIKELKFLSREEAREKLRSLLPAPNEETIEAGFELNDADFIIGSIGNLYKTKGFMHFINAINLLINNGIRIKAIIIGDGPEKEELINLIRQFKLQKNIILAGRIDNSSELLKAFNIYACSSVKEGLSYTIMEAMQAELPIVATRVGGNDELIEHKKEGFLVGHKNADSLARGIIEVLNNAGLMKTMAANARKKALNEFSLAKMINNTRAVYESLF